MKPLRYMRVAYESIMVNKMRAILTMLGLIIGVASVLTTIGIGRGAAVGVTQEIEGQGTNTLTISPQVDSLSEPSSLTSAGSPRASRSTTVGSFIRVRASSTRCRSPELSELNVRSAKPPQPRSANSASARLRSCSS